ncbi:MAG TPA: 4Fe-4S single cluster domain-containing protein [Kofleriaceae bacterium]|nr:4Fe-4S single cluster domain-containing protein [Kofleriaceae bacterium]
MTPREGAGPRPQAEPSALREAQARPFDSAQDGEAPRAASGIDIVRIHAHEPRSRANGPGERFVIWFQGCTLGCPGCFNPTTHAASGGREVAAADLIAQALAAEVEGITLSGGEPLQQPEAALALLSGAKQAGLSTLVFSGYTIDEIRALPLGPQILAQLDVLIDGRYVSTDRHASGLRGSANQRIHCLTDRYAVHEVEQTPVAEIRIAPDGSAVLTGVDPLKLKRR